MEEVSIYINTQSQACIVHRFGLGTAYIPIHTNGF